LLSSGPAAGDVPVLVPLSAGVLPDPLPVISSAAGSVVVSVSVGALGIEAPSGIPSACGGSESNTRASSCQVRC
jgi:hypothetical protein